MSASANGSWDIGDTGASIGAEASFERSISFSDVISKISTYNKSVREEIDLDLSVPNYVY